MPWPTEKATWPSWNDDASKSPAVRPADAWQDEQNSAVEWHEAQVVSLA
jgi:hypothetical protein